MKINLSRRVLSLLKHLVGHSASAFVFVVGLMSQGFATEDWGAYVLVPVSAPAMALETLDTEPREGTSVTIGKNVGNGIQKWSISARGEDGFVIHPFSKPDLVLSVEGSGSKNGTRIVLQKDGSQPSQLWWLKKQENGSYNLIPKHAPAMGVDLFGGVQTPGARVDLWQNSGADAHLQWMIKPLAGSLAQPVPNQDSTARYEPQVLKDENVVPGVIKQFTFAQSKVFPGTVREVTVFIPAQYDGSKPACVYVKTDGYNPREKALMERMIAGKEMPVAVGVFVRPGEVSAPMKGTLGRRNRDFEYDGVGDQNVRFLVDELLPFVAKEFGLNLSTDGNDRCMSGGEQWWDCRIHGCLASP